jgi:hypothetical protein
MLGIGKDSVCKVTRFRQQRALRVEHIGNCGERKDTQVSLRLGPATTREEGGLMTADVVPSDPEGDFGPPDAVASLDPLFDQLGDGYGGSAFVVGGAGLGKTTFLRHAEARARSWTAPRVGRLLVGRADGVLFGSGHAFRYVDQLYASLGADFQPLPLRLARS